MSYHDQDADVARWAADRAADAVETHAARVINRLVEEILAKVIALAEVLGTGPRQGLGEVGQFGDDAVTAPYATTPGPSSATTAATRPRPTMTADFHDVWADLTARIERYGFTMVGVFPTADDPDDPPFTYTINAAAALLSGNEFLIAGLPAATCSDLLNTTYALVQDGWRPEQGELVEGIADCPLRTQLMSDAHPANLARRWWGREEVVVWQLVWPDKEGRFPGDPGCPDWVTTAQTVEGTQL